MDRRIVVGAVGWLLLHVFLSAPVAALSEKQRSFDELVNLSDVVLVGTVSDLRSAWGEGNFAGHIFTYVTFTHLDVIKGRVSGAEFTLRLLGGRVGNTVHHYPGAPRFKEGETYTLFVRNNFQDIFPLVGVHQGILRVLWDEERREYIVVSSDGQALAGVPPADRPLKSVYGDDRSRSLSLTDFIDEIKKRLSP